MNYKLKNRDILYGNKPICPYPEHLLKRVDSLTTEVPGPLKNWSHSDSAAARCNAGVYGEKIKNSRKRIIQKIPIGASFFEIRTNIRDINNERRNPVADKKGPLPMDPHVLARHFKCMGYFMGADQMAICEIPEGCTFTDDENGNPVDTSMYKYAIVFVKRKDMNTTLASDGYDWIFDTCSHQVYQMLAVWSDTMANYIRRHGWQAEASNMRNYITLMTPLILAAGIGESSRLGIALSPFFGANFKASAVLTDLPLECDKPIDFGLQEYCKKCTICADACPCKAIPRQEEKVLYHGYMTWGTDFDKCAINNSYNPKGANCGNCTRVCPWNRPDSMPEDFKEWDGSIEWLHEKVNARAEYIRSNGLHDERELTDKWWFEIEDNEHELIIPVTTEYEELPEVE